jgi:CBS domain-containing protein
LAPLLTIGGCLGTAFAAPIAAWAPTAIDPRTAALVGMASLFAGASRAPLASVLFALEATHEANTALPLLCGCIVSYLVSCRLMQNSIMTEKIARRGVAAPTEYVPDVLAHVFVRDAASLSPVTLSDEQTVSMVRDWLCSGTPESSHQGFPVVDARGAVVGVVTRRELQYDLEPDQTLRNVLRRPPIVVYDDCSVREATEHMLRHDVGRLPVVRRDKTKKLVGILTRSDILAAYSRRQTPLLVNHSRR